MTIRLRERLYRAFFAAAASATILAVVAIWIPGLDGLERVRATAFPSLDAVGFYSALAASGICAVYAAVVSGLIVFRSGRTVSVEIFFFSLWAFCQVFELARIGSALLGMANANIGAYSLMTRFALFGRYSGSIGLFAGSLFSVGLKQERALPSMTFAFMAGLLFASIHPLNSVAPGADLLADRGIEPLARSFELAILALALIDYCLAWRSVKDKAYLLAAAGLTMCVVATTTLRAMATPWAVIAATPILVAGTWLYIKSMHDYYLWR
ncbi:MAG TPA: hypothetical protein PLQ29_04010 [Spirochaetales bacterium]|nr:hypothetical protein [Spirochaetales bacterium]HPM71521.1 hypothetical protein [Spirochaetales bacterium]